jgi:serine protease Do
MQGEVVGVNTAIYSPSGGSVGIAFSIPASTVKTVIAQLKDHGSVSRGWIGVQIQPVTQDIADSLGLKKAEGALVADPQKDGSAAKAGVEAGDVITAVNGQKIRDDRELARVISGIAPGATAKLESCIRERQGHQLALVTAECRKPKLTPKPVPMVRTTVRKFRDLV